MLQTVTIPAFQFTRPRRSVSRVFIHCTASSRPEHDDIDVIREWHLDRGFADVGYHAMIHEDGGISWGRSLEKIPAAQKTPMAPSPLPSTADRTAQTTSRPSSTKPYSACAKPSTTSTRTSPSMATPRWPARRARHRLPHAPQPRPQGPHAARPAPTRRQPHHPHGHRHATSTVGAVGLSAATALEVVDNARETASEVGEHANGSSANPSTSGHFWRDHPVCRAHSVLNRMNFFRKQDHDKGYK